MEEKKGEGHDQETQTNFDMNGSVLTHPPSSIQPSIPILDRNPNTYSNVPTWGPRYSCQPPSYPENYYPYEPGYPPPPPQHPYYPGRNPHWHHSDTGVVYPPNPGSSVHVGPFRPEYPRRNFYPPSHNDSVPLRNADIARPKAEWPRAYQQFAKPTIPSQYLATMHSGHRNVQAEFGGPPSTATSLRSTVLDVAGSSISSPRASAHLTRKRPRPNTPASSIESIDLNMLIRNSPDSLLGCLTGSRISSAGSFGHLSPLGFCTSSACHRAPSSAMHPMRPPPFITPPPIQPQKMHTKNQEQPRDVFPSSTTDIPKEEPTAESMNCAESPPAASKPAEVPSSCMKEEAAEICKLDSTTSPGISEVPVSTLSAFFFTCKLL